jgi:hypothetical protein
MSSNEDTAIGSVDDTRQQQRYVGGATAVNGRDDNTLGRTNVPLESDTANVGDALGHRIDNDGNLSSNLESFDRLPDERKRSKDHTVSKSRNDRIHSRQHRSDGKHHEKKKSSKKRQRHKDNKYDSDDYDDSESSSNSDDSYSSYSDNDNDRRRRKHSKDKKKKHESKRHKKDDDRSKDKKSKKKKRKKEGRRDDKDTTENFVSATPTFGQYGIIKASDMAKMQRSFEIWLSEVHGVHMSSSNIPRYELQQYFDTYREDYNTATLPHVKYYNYDKWELEEHERLKRESDQSGQNNSALINDERKHAMELQRIAKQKEEAALQLVAATMNTTKVKEMQHQKQLQSQMQMAFKMGDHETYRKIKEKLQPPDK